MQIGERPVVMDANDWARWTAHELRTVVAYYESPRQKIEILDLARFGLSLWIDSWPQFAMLDEHRYHQLLVFPALFYHPKPKDVLILGGGDRLAAWRTLMRRGVGRVKIADWDAAVTALVGAHIVDYTVLGVSDDNPRLEGRNEIDVNEYLRETSERFDVVIGDLTDIATLEGILPNAAEHIARILKPGGVFATQAGELSIAEKPLESLRASVGTFKKIFRDVWVYGYPIESFAYTQCFLAGWKDRVVEPQPPKQKDFCKRFVATEIAKDRPFYGPAIHRAAFGLALDPAVRAAVEEA